MDDIRNAISERAKHIVKTVLYGYYTRKNIKRTKRKQHLDVAIFTFLGENWNSFETIYAYAKERKRVSIEVIVFPKCVNGKLDIELYESTIDFFDNREIDFTPAYNQETNEWISIDNYNWDYVFYDEPYDVYYGQFSITRMYKKARICYIPYGNTLSDSRKLLSVVMPKTFFYYVYNFFPSGIVLKREGERLLKEIRGKHHHLIDLGFPRYDLYVNLPRAVSDDFSILWIPRYALPGINIDDPSSKSTFFDFKDEIIQDAQRDSTKNWIIRPHPAAFSNFVKNKVMSQQEINDYIRIIEECRKTKIDTNKDYLDGFIHSDVLLADFSTLIIEYILLGKPVVYCGAAEAIADKELLSVLYTAINWDEAIALINNIKNGVDPLKDNRLIYARKALNSGNAGKKVVDYLCTELEG